MSLLLEIVLRPADTGVTGELSAALAGATTLPVELCKAPAGASWFAPWRSAKPAGPRTVRVRLDKWASLPAARKTLDTAAGAIATRAASIGYAVESTTVIAEDQKRVAVRLPSCPVDSSTSTQLTLPPLDSEALRRHFGQLVARDAQIRLVYDSLRAAVESKFQRRPHVLLYGPAGCGKSELVKAFASFLGHGAVWHLDATTLTKAGLETELLNRSKSGTLPPVIILEEVEKSPPGVLRCLLQVMDSRAAIQKTDARRGDVRADCRSLLIATANDLAKLQKLQAGALASRFAFRLLCPRPTLDGLRAIVSKAAAKPAYAEAVMVFLAELSTQPIPGVDATDPRFALSLLAGGERLLDGSFFADWRVTV